MKKLIILLTLLCTGSAFAQINYKYSCYKLVQRNIVNNFNESAYKRACKKIQNHNGYYCVKDVFSMLRRPSYLNLINACATVTTGTQLDCASEEIYNSTRRVFTNLPKKIKECTEW